MKKFSEFLEGKDENLVEAGGMGSLKTQCMVCGKNQATSQFLWNSGRARCKACGGRVDMIPDQISTGESPAVLELMQKIKNLEDPSHDPSLNHDDRMALLFGAKRRLQKLKPEMHIDFSDFEH